MLLLFFVICQCCKSQYKISQEQNIYPHCDVQCLLGGKEDTYFPLLFGGDRHGLWKLIHIHTCVHTCTVTHSHWPLSLQDALPKGIDSFILNICKRAQTNQTLLQFKSIGFYPLCIICKVEIICLKSNSTPLLNKLYDIIYHSGQKYKWVGQFMKWP